MERILLPYTRNIKLLYAFLSHFVSGHVLAYYFCCFVSNFLSSNYVTYMFQNTIMIWIERHIKIDLMVEIAYLLSIFYFFCLIIDVIVLLPMRSISCAFFGLISRISKKERYGRVVW